MYITLVNTAYLFQTCYHTFQGPAFECPFQQKISRFGHVVITGCSILYGTEFRCSVMANRRECDVTKLNVYSLVPKKLLKATVKHQRV